LLQGIIAQGWTRIKIKIVNVRKVGDVILVANAYSAIGSGANAGKTLEAASSHVLVHTGPAVNGFQPCTRRDEAGDAQALFCSHDAVYCAPPLSLKISTNDCCG
jgi:hypothetical protein